MKLIGYRKLIFALVTLPCITLWAYKNWLDPTGVRDVAMALIAMLGAGNIAERVGQSWVDSRGGTYTITEKEIIRVDEGRNK